MLCSFILFIPYYNFPRGKEEIAVSMTVEWHYKKHWEVKVYEANVYYITVTLVTDRNADR